MKFKEDLSSDKQMLDTVGMEYVEVEEMGNYYLILIKMSDGEGGYLYNVGMSSGELNFTTPEDQFVKTNPDVSLREIMSTSRNIIKVITKWVDKYDKLIVGSYNNKKTKQYHRILSRLGFNVSGFDVMFGVEYFEINKSPMVEFQVKDFITFLIS